ncbi:hypothetical protein GWC77_23735 [Paraburkholderia sp. NMBU_R16]|uniref:hypothetical protein n=1 Tax=Paraburkholderia sp. NMBU_R16 TaxID=2698676 RepID=UPI00156640BE|nr:hypothetical protein [Paraburkholderia sp. NMBU_R16]NRO98921.1 hypothetical protein [Paraburkholderia sp. NMBU_R16]
MAILLLDPADGTIRECAKAWKARYGISRDRSFTVPIARTHRCAGEVLSNFQRLEPGSLSFSDLTTKLIVVSHGCPNGLFLGRTMLDAPDFANTLAAWGLTSVGLLAFRGCLLGKANFLDRLVPSLSYANIEVGWLLGYKREAISLGIDPGWLKTPRLPIDTQLNVKHEGCHHPMATERRKPPRVVAHEGIGFYDRLLREATQGRSKLPDEQRVKVVQGNRVVAPPNGSSPRYPAYLETLV